MFIGLLNMVQDSLCKNTHHNMSLSSIFAIFALRYYASGAFQVNILDCYMSIEAF